MLNFAPLPLIDNFQGEILSKWIMVGYLIYCGVVLTLVIYFVLYIIVYVTQSIMSFILDLIDF